MDARRRGPHPLWLAAHAIAMTIACAPFEKAKLDRRHGEAEVRNREVASLVPGAIDYDTQVRPILEARCVVCHACYDAPCQLKLGSVEGIDRGTSPELVYDGTRLLAADPSRLFEDAKSTEGWRKRGFHPVLNDRRSMRRGNRDASVLARSLELKRAHPVTPGGLLPDDVDLSLGREQQCPTIERAKRHARKHPDWGMPFGLPGLEPDEHELVMRWLDEGALHRVAADLPATALADVARWEAFLNEDALEVQLAARYIYEHLFLAHLYFDDGKAGAPPRYYELVRSRTPPGEPVDRIAARRPYDSPGVTRVYYRVIPVREAIVAKLHLPYRLDAARMKRWRALFHDAGYHVAALPSYAPHVAANPFVAFRAIPADSRYRFMLDEAEFTIMGFIKGAVCRGPIALNVIDDRFWVFFIDPDVESQVNDAEFLYAHAEDLRMPAGASSNAPPLVTWLHQSKDESRWAAAKQQALSAEAKGGHPPALARLWDGEGHNHNANLTVFRHFDSASVVKGLVGDAPKTAWVIDYPLLERIHYLLVAGYDVYGNVGHQLATRTYMDFLRMESEFAYLRLLPQSERERVRNFWYRDTDERAYREIVETFSNDPTETGVTFASERPQHELAQQLVHHFAALDEPRWDLDDPRVPKAMTSSLQALGAVAGRPLKWVPQSSYLLVRDAPDGAELYSLLRNDGHTNIASPFGEKKRRAPLEDTLTVARGFVSAHPNAFYVVDQAELPAFVARIAALQSEADYAELQHAFGIRRTDPEFWATSDRLAAIYLRDWPVEAGLLDLARVEDR